MPAGFELHWYRIERVLGQGGFGLTYLAYDINLERSVAIKEYMPAQISVRESDNLIHPLSTEEEEDFQWGLKRFISEARNLTKFEHPNLVRVFNVFEANNTAYMVMNYETGKSLREVLKTKQTLSEEELIRLLFPLMDGLESVHNKGFVHRDIKPGNIFIRTDGSPVLLDFGSARQTRGFSDSKTLTNFVSPGYAPIEQYASKSDRQGPWTDIYGLGATAYEVMTGNMPEAAIDRSVTISDNAGDNLISASMMCKGRYSEKILAAVDHALAFNAQERPQNIGEWRKEFGVDQSQLDTLKIPPQQLAAVAGDMATVKMDQTPHAKTRSTDMEIEKAVVEEPYVKTEKLTTPQPASTKSKNSIWIITAVVACVAVFAIVGFIVFWPTLEAPAPVTNVARKVPEVKPKKIIPTVPTKEDKIAKILKQAEEDIAALRLTTPADNNAYDKYRKILAMDEDNVDALNGIEVIIGNILKQARADVVALRLTTPANNNAYDKYRKILAMDENNADALRGIEVISDKYTQFVYENIDSHDLERAQYFLTKAEQVSPTAPKVLVARKALETAIEENRSVFSKIKKWFD